MDSSECAEIPAGTSRAVERFEHLPRAVPRWVLWLLWAIVLVVPVFSTVLVVFYLDIETNFQELYANGRQVLETWRLDQVYLERKPGYYPPSAMPFFMAWSALPPVAACVVSCALYGLLFFLVARELPAEAAHVHPRQYSHAWLYMGLVVGLYMHYDIVMGQVSAIPVFALIAGYVYWRRGRTWPAAAALAFGITFKLLPGVAVLFFAVKRQWKLVAATGLLSLVFGVVPGLVLFGPAKVAAGWRGYHRFVAYPKSHPVEHEGRLRWTKPANALNPSLDITLLRWLSDYPQDHHTPFLPVAHFSQQAVYRGYRILIFAMGVVTFWMCRRRMGRDSPVSLATQYGVVLVWMTLLSPHLFIYYMIWLAWPAAVMMGYVGRRHLLENRSDLLNSLPVWVFALSYLVTSERTVLGVGMHPALLLAFWGVLLADLVRGRFFELDAR